MFKRFSERFRNRKLSMRMKFTLSLMAIAVCLLVSSVISILEYDRMSNYVSELIAENVKSINMAQQLSEVSNSYNLAILSAIGDSSLTRLPEMHQKAFMSHCDSLRKSLTSIDMQPLADSVVYSYSAYMLTSLELNDVMLSDFIDTRSWYFERLQPRFQRLSRDIDNLAGVMYGELKKNSLTFQRGFYRSIIPGTVAVGVGLLLIMMLLFFVLAYYVNPIYKMLSGLDAYRSSNKKYTYDFDGDDQLSELNDGISEIIVENQQLRKRLTDLRARMNNEEK